MENNLNLFDLDDSGMADADFFAVAEEQEQPNLENKDQAPNPDDSEDSKDQEEDKKPEDLFSEVEEEQEEEEEEGDDKQKPSTNEEPIDEDQAIKTLKFLKEKGIADFELEELTADKADEILEDTLDTMFEDRIEELFTGMPDIVKNLNKFVLDGGDINEYLDTVAKSKESSLTPDMDLEKEENLILAVKQGLKSEGYDNEYIEAQIEFLKDSNRLEKHGKMHFKKWDTDRQKQEQAVLASRQTQKENQKKLHRELKGKVSSFLAETEEVPGFKVSREDKRILPSYMTDRAVKLENGNQVTGMQSDLMRVLNSPTGSFQLAKLLRSASEGGELNFEHIAKETETKVTKKVREEVRRNKNSIQKDSTGSGSKNKRPLADYFN